MCSICWTLCSFPPIYLSLFTPVNTPFLWPWLCRQRRPESRCVKISDTAFSSGVWAILTPVGFRVGFRTTATLSFSPLRPNRNRVDVVDQFGQDRHLTCYWIFWDVLIKTKSLPPSTVSHHKQHRRLLTPGVDSNHWQVMLSCHLVTLNSDTMQLRQRRVPHVGHSVPGLPSLPCRCHSNQPDTNPFLEFNQFAWSIDKLKCDWMRVIWCNANRLVGIQ